MLEQDVSRWSKEMIGEAEHWLRTASQFGKAGRFQFESAIQSAHSQRKWSRHTEWPTIAVLYDGLVHVSPTLGALVGRAAAVAEAQSAAVGWELLETLPKDLVRNYQPYWALTASILTKLERYAEAITAYTRAIGLCEDTSMREFLARQLQKLKGKNH